MAGNSPSDAKAHYSARSRVRHQLETVAEMPNEASGECTERLVQSRGSANLRQSSPFVVEKIELDLDEIQEEVSFARGLPPKGASTFKSEVAGSFSHKKSPEIVLDKSVLDSDADTKFPAQSYRTPIKPENSRSFFSPSQASNAKHGFFSMRKKTGGKTSDSGQSSAGGPTVIDANSSNNKIKIVNNIFQNTFLQNYVKPEAQTKRKITEVKFDSKSKGAIRKKVNCSLDIKENKTARPIVGQLSPQQISGKRFSFHIPAGAGLTQTPKPKNVSTLRQSTLEESGMSSRVPDHDRKYRQMVKFHEKLSALIQDVEGGAGEVDLKTSWRFVKSMVQGYVEARQKIKKLETIINSK